MTGGADYAAYLWAAYGVSAAVLAYNVLSAWLLERRVRREVQDTHRETAL